MKHSRLLAVIGGIALVAPVLHAQNTPEQQLPSAPSAVLQQQQQKAKPAPPPQTTAPAADPAPAATTPSQPAAQPAQTPAPTPAAASTLPPPPEDADSAYKFVADVSEVNVIFTVSDKHGRFVKDLKQSDFKILDDNKMPKQVDYFRAETDLPLRVGLLIDASNSVRDRFTFEQESAIEFLNQIIRPKSDRAFVIGFDTTAEVTQDFTDNTEKLSRGVRNLRAGGGTAMYDALYWACRDKLMKEDVKGPARRAIILLSDGEDNQSRVTREEAIEMAQRAEVIVYAISTNVSGIKMRGDKVLERIAEATGGRAFFPFKVQDVANAFSEIQDELRSQYALAYKPDDFKADGRYRTIDIAAIGKDKNLHVRARKGYFAPKQ
jgi:VWFA-related protein